jgi:hypothetical protein
MWGRARSIISISRDRFFEVGFDYLIFPAEWDKLTQDRNKNSGDDLNSAARRNGSAIENGETYGV